MKKIRVLAMMSGGVDSTVMAAKLIEQGYEVIGLTLSLSWNDEQETCCGVTANCRAARVCAKLGIEHHTLNQRLAFEKHVIQDAYITPHANGETPSPCVSCNAKVKIGGMLKYAAMLDCDLIATGHYANIVDDEIHLAADQSKDQTYMLSMIPKDIIPKMLFPLGNMVKSDVRAMAAELGLEAPSDSQDLCFVSRENRLEFLTDRGVQMTPGEIVDESGKVLGTHKGIQNYTVGQRKGLGLSGGEKLHVIRLSKSDNRVIVGSNSTANGCVTKAFNWLATPKNPQNLTCKVRYRSTMVEVEAIGPNEFRFKNSSDGMTIAPGQVIAVWEGSKLLGGGIIDRAV